MADGEFKGILIAFIMLSLFTFLILTFAVQVSSKYDINNSEITGGALNLDPYEDVLEDIESDAQDRREAFEKKGVFALGETLFSGIWDVAKVMISMITTPFYLFAQIMENILNVPTVVTSVILGVITLLIIFALWSLIKTGR